MSKEPRFVEMTHMVSTVPSDECETIFCNKMVPRPVNRTTKTPDEIDCPRCRSRLIREALAYADASPYAGV